MLSIKQKQNYFKILQALLSTCITKAICVHTSSLEDLSRAEGVPGLPLA